MHEEVDGEIRVTGTCDLGAPDCRGLLRFRRRHSFFRSPFMGRPTMCPARKRSRRSSDCVIRCRPVGVLGWARPACVSERACLLVAFSPNGFSVVSGGWNGAMSLLGREDRKTPGNFARRPAGLFWFRLILRTECISSGSARISRCGDVPTGKQLFKTKSSTGWLSSVAFTPDGKSFATVGCA